MCIFIVLEAFPGPCLALYAFPDSLFHTVVSSEVVMLTFPNFPDHFIDLQMIQSTTFSTKICIFLTNLEIKSDAIRSSLFVTLSHCGPLFFSYKWDIFSYLLETKPQMEILEPRYSF